MHLLVIRHAIAEDREEFAKTQRDDGERPLTRFGRRRMRRNARGLRRVGPPIDVLASSPLVRADETARIVSDVFGLRDNLVYVDALTPEQKPDALVPWLKQQPPDGTVALVGHEPHLSRLVTWLLTGDDQSGSRVLFKKGGACLLDLGEGPRAGGATLLWLLTPAQLRAAAD
ncbi:MAG: SixA phosphatase family protein [Gemmatimonadaceae bacterium]